MEKQSITISGLIAFLLIWIFQSTGVEILPQNVQAFIIVSGKIISLLTVWFGRWRQGDINLLGRKQKPFDEN